MPASLEAPDATIITPKYNAELAEQKRAALRQRFEEADVYIDKFLRFTGALVAPELEPVEFQPERFAVIKASGGIAEAGNEEELEQFAETVATLNILGLPTTVIHGAGNQISEKLLAAGVESQINPDGTRITPAEDMWAVKEALSEVGDRIHEALVDHGALVQRPSGLFVAELTNPEDFGSAESVQEVDSRLIQNITRSGSVALAGCLGLTTEGQWINVNADKIWTAAAGAVKPTKAISLTRQEGILTEEGGQLISELTSEEALQMIDSGAANGGSVVKLRGAVELARDHVIDDVVVTNVAKLEQELYTSEGGGTDIHA